MASDKRRHEMRDSMLKVLEEHARANLELHKMNVKVYLNNPAGIGEHSDVMEAVQIELVKMATRADRLEMIKSHF